MTRNFDEWNTEKKAINEKEIPHFFVKSRQVWFTKMGEDVGAEQNGKKEFSRPVLVIKKVDSLFFTVALTTKGKSENNFYLKLNDLAMDENHLNNIGRSWLILSQVRVMDKRRFLEKIGTLGREEFNSIKQKLTTLLF